LDIETVKIDERTFELQWRGKDERLHREQSCDRGSPGEVQKHLQDRIGQLNGDKEDEAPDRRHGRSQVRR
jgi:hypothetical protein